VFEKRVPDGGIGFFIYGIDIDSRSSSSRWVRPRFFEEGFLGKRAARTPNHQTKKKPMPKYRHGLLNFD